MKLLTHIALICLVLILPLFAKDVATITAMKGSVTIENSAGSRNASLGSKLEEKDSVITAKKSKAQIIFEDETIVTVGKNSHFSIQEYLYEAGQKPKAEFGLLKGAMSTITGKIGKIAPEKFLVKTKTATIGIRGTNFTIIVLEDGSQKVYCTYGAISVTINGQVYIVKQGYNVTISPTGEVTLQAFTPNELAGMKSSYFTEPEPLKGKASEDETEYSNGFIIDTTRDSIGEYFIDDITEQIQDAVQTATPTSTNIVMTGWSVDYFDRYTDMTPKVSLSFAQDGSAFDSANSWLQVLNKSNSSGNGENDNWKFFISSVPTAYTSRDNFSTTFSSVELTPLTGSTSVNAVLAAGSSFTAIADLSPNDFMSWGVWNASVDFESVQSGVLLPDSHSFNGLWVSGEPTDPTVIAGLNTFVTYTGDYKVFSVSTAFAPEDGAGLASLDVDFASDQATLTLIGNNGALPSSYQFNNMVVSGNTVSGGTISLGSGSANGTFYGPTGTSVGGNFQITDGSTVDVKGVYQVTQLPIGQP